MPSSFREPKTLPEWIELDYYRRRRRLLRVRTAVIWLTLLICAAGIAGVSFLPMARWIYESRPVSAAHMMFNDRCEVCHTESFRPAVRFLSSNPHLPSVKDDTCTGCHDGPPHQEGKVNDPNCAECHKEHKGQPILARVRDGLCIDCHKDLKPEVHETIYDPKITGFAENSHPEFGTWRKGGSADQGTIRFSHRDHMNLDKQRARGIDQQLAKLQEKSCLYCHQPDSAGRYMKAINYEQHCSSCHPLSIQIDDSEKPALEKAIRAFNQVPAPHKEPAIVRAELEERYRLFADDPSVWQHPESKDLLRQLPGWGPTQVLTSSRETWVKEQVRQSERMLFDGAGGCRFCHAPEKERKSDDLPIYKPSRIRSILIADDRVYPHSQFSHSRHRMLDCSECHHKARESERTAVMPKIADCVVCHNSKVGARTECIECHRYHHPTATSSAAQPMTIEQAIGQERRSIRNTSEVDSWPNK
jgi:predicted CXXCH cytochrome family protein